MTLRSLRKSLKISQKQLAELMKVRQSTVAMWESGKSFPRADKLPELAKILGCTLDDLFDKT
jgi:putative transcriptional regulator